jgi:hypothetical protein
MPIVVGTLLIQNADYLTTVSAVDVTLNGSQIELSYVKAGLLKAGSISCVNNPDGTLPSIMSGCTIIP